MAVVYGRTEETVNNYNIEEEKNKEGPSVRMKYDITMDGIRVVKAEIDGFLISMTCNMNLCHCTVKITHEDSLYPQIQYVNGTFSLCYQHTVLLPEDMDSFETAWKKTRQFCDQAKGMIEEMKNRIEKGEKL